MAQAQKLQRFVDKTDRLRDPLKSHIFHLLARMSNVVQIVIIIEFKSFPYKSNKNR